MKNIVYVIVAILFVACQTAPCECEKETNGFGPFEGQSYILVLKKLLMYLMLLMQLGQLEIMKR